MAGWVKDLSKSSRDGGNEAIFVQLKVAADGSYIDATAADVFGGAAKTGYHIGNFVSSNCSRQSGGDYKAEFTLMEQDLARLNALELMAPISAADTSADQLIMEDNVAYVGSKQGSFDSGKPVFALYYFYKALGGKKRCRLMVGQWQTDGGFQGAKAKQWNQQKWTFNSIDTTVNGSITPAAITQPTDSAFGTLTTPALASPYQFGKVLEEA